MKKTMSVCAVVAGMAAAAIGADGTVIFKDDFENGLNGWKAHGSADRWQVVADGGMPGAYATPPTKGLVYTRRKGEADSRYIYKTIPVKPGQRLRITSWMYAEELKCSTPGAMPHMSVGIGNAKGLPTWEGSNRYNEKDEKSFGDWHKISFVTSPVKAGCDRMDLCLGLASESFGTAHFDNVTVEVSDMTVIERLAATSRSASHGQVAFTVRVYDEGPVRLASGAWTREMARAGETATLTVDVADFALGANTVTATLVGTDGKTLGTASMPFLRTPVDPKETARKTYIDGHRRLVVNGKPVYPLGLFWVYHDEKNPEYFELLKTTPFNFVIAYEKAMRTELMDLFQSCGKGVFVSLSSIYGFPKGYRAWPPKEVVDVPSANRYATNIIEKQRNHPALWGWYTFDELALELVPQVRARYDLIRTLDPEHIVTGCQWDTKPVADFVSAADTIGVDRYPVGDVVSTEYEKSHPKMRVQADSCRAVVKATGGLKPVWQAVQAYSWHEDFPGKEYEWMRYPNLAECRAQAWFNIAAGADGLTYFASAGLMKMKKKGRPYDDLIKSVNEVARLSDVLLSTERPPKVGGDGKDLAVRAFLHKGQLYVVACNLTWNPTKVTLPIEGAWRNPVAEVQSEGVALSVANGGAETKLALDLPPIGVAVVRLTR